MARGSVGLAIDREDIARLVEFNKRFWESAAYLNGCLEWKRKTKRQGYGAVTVKVAGRWMNTVASRVAYALAYGAVPAGVMVRHTCDNPRCILPAHLVLGTNADNMRDMVERGRSRKNGGERNSSARLTRAQAGEIRERYAAGGISQEALGAQYGVVQATVSRIVGGQLWPGEGA